MILPEHGLAQSLAAGLSADLPADPVLVDDLDPTADRDDHWMSLEKGTLLSQPFGSTHVVGIKPGDQGTPAVPGSRFSA